MVGVKSRRIRESTKNAFFGSTKGFDFPNIAKSKEPSGLLGLKSPQVIQLTIEHKLMA